MILAIMMSVCVLSGCKKAENVEQPEIIIEESVEVPDVEALENDEQQTSTEESNHEEVATKSLKFSDISNLRFDFSSGVGAWNTELMISQDGTFHGMYHDTDMGNIGEEYPDGTRYFCAFSGKFTQPEYVNDYTYSVQIAEIKLENEVDTEEIVDGVLYRYSEPYGLEDAKDIYIYLPGAPLAELPQEYRDWVMQFADETQLPCYGLYNVNAQNGFSSCETEAGFSVDKRLAEVEQKAAELEDKLQNEVAQQKMNIIASEMNQLWDDELNRIWSELEETLDTAAMEALRVEEREWIADKEEEIRKAGLEVEGGTMQPLVTNRKGAKLTKERVYELAEVLKENQK